MEEWFQSLQVNILVPDEFKIPITGGYSIGEGDWTSFVTAIPATWLYTTFKQKQESLFSANIRGYLGSRSRNGSKINSGIQSTAKDDPEHFWVFNNGITALVNNFEVLETNINSTLETTLVIQGISIVNGAQTTGAIGSLSSIPNTSVMVPARFVKCNSTETINKIIEFNNKQNPVEPADFRSNDPIQKRLRAEFNSIPNAKYLGGRRGGAEDRVRRSTGIHILASDTVAQALAAFHQDPVIAYNQKSDIWLSNTLYPKYFNEQTSAEHIVFVYSLLRAIEEKKRDLFLAQKLGSLTQPQNQQLNFLGQRGSHFLLSAAIAKCLEIYLGQSVPNTFRVSFGVNKSSESAKTLWKPIVDSSISLSHCLLPAVRRSLNNDSEVKQVINVFCGQVGYLSQISQELYQTFASSIEIKQ